MKLSNRLKKINFFFILFFIFFVGLKLILFSISWSDKGNKLFHAGTKYEDNKILTSGGRVFCATALGSDLKEAQQNAYNLVEKVEFDGSYFRKDIGFKGIK